MNFDFTKIAKALGAVPAAVVAVALALKSFGIEVPHILTDQPALDQMVSSLLNVISLLIVAAGPLMVYFAPKNKE